MTLLKESGIKAGAAAARLPTLLAEVQ